MGERHGYPKWSPGAREPELYDALPNVAVPLLLFPATFFQLSVIQVKTMNSRHEIQYYATAQERKLAEDREENFRGTARVSLRRLLFKPEYSRDVDKKNIERLKRIFARQGCLRLLPPNHVPAIITELDLKAALQHSARTLEDLLNSGQGAHLRS